jgi:hypothetical protein
MPADWQLCYPVASKAQLISLAFPFPRSVREKGGWDEAQSRRYHLACSIHGRRELWERPDLARDWCAGALLQKRARMTSGKHPGNTSPKSTSPARPIAVPPESARIGRGLRNPADFLEAVGSAFAHTRGAQCAALSPPQDPRFRSDEPPPHPDRACLPPVSASRGAQAAIFGGRRAAARMDTNAIPSTKPFSPTNRGLSNSGAWQSNCPPSTATVGPCGRCRNRRIDLPSSRCN